MTVGRLVKVVLVVVWVVVRDVPVNVPRTVRCRSVVVICALCAVLWVVCELCAVLWVVCELCAVLWLCAWV